MAEEAEKPSLIETLFAVIGGAVGAVIGKEAVKLFSKTSFHTFIEERVGGYGISRGIVLVSMFTALCLIALWGYPAFFPLAGSWLWFAAPVWAPIVFGVVLWRSWMWYINSLFIARLRWVLFEIKMPHHVHKSPRAMEMVIETLWFRIGETTFVDRWWDGKVLPEFSFEYASFGGDVHFYIRCDDRFRDVVQSSFYAQYPDAELFEVEDYTLKFVYDPQEYDMFGNEIIFTNGPVLPFKTYIEHELEKEEEDEMRVSPLAQVIETLSALQGSEQAWVHIMFRPHSKKSEWKEVVEHAIEEIRRKAALRPGELLAPGEVPQGFPHVTWEQSEMIKALERNLAKRTYEVGIRLCYLAKYADYRMATRQTIRWIFVPFGWETWNTLRPARWHGPYDWPWQDYKQIRWRLTNRWLLDAMRRRSYFNYPWKARELMMSSEEIASLFHPPTGIIKSPGYQPVHAKKGDAPHNLPV